MIDPLTGDIEVIFEGAIVRRSGYFGVLLGPLTELSGPAALASAFASVRLISGLGLLFLP